jgi:hypothetical protein
LKRVPRDLTPSLGEYLASRPIEPDRGALDGDPNAVLGGEEGRTLDLPTEVAT